MKGSKYDCGATPEVASAGAYEGGPCAMARGYISEGAAIRTPHTYLDGTAPLKYLGLWTVGVSHSTATMSSGETCVLYGLRLMHRLNISLSCFGPRAGQALFFALDSL